jgi:hypothetical protein
MQDATSLKTAFCTVSDIFWRRQMHRVRSEDGLAQKDTTLSKIESVC